MQLPRLVSLLQRLATPRTTGCCRSAGQQPMGSCAWLMPYEASQLAHPCSSLPLHSLPCLQSKFQSCCEYRRTPRAAPLLVPTAGGELTAEGEPQMQVCGVGWLPVLGAVLGFSAGPASSIRIACQCRRCGHLPAACPPRRLAFPLPPPSPAGLPRAQGVLRPPAGQVHPPGRAALVRCQRLSKACCTGEPEAPSPSAQRW